VSILDPNGDIRTGGGGGVNAFCENNPMHSRNTNTTR